MRVNTKKTPLGTEVDIYLPNGTLAQILVPPDLVPGNHNLPMKILDPLDVVENVLKDMRQSLGQMSNFHSSRIEDWINQLEIIL